MAVNVNVDSNIRSNMETQLDLILGSTLAPKTHACETIRRSLQTPPLSGIPPSSILGLDQPPRVRNFPKHLNFHSASPMPNIASKFNLVYRKDLNVRIQCPAHLVVPFAKKKREIPSSYEFVTFQKSFNKFVKYIAVIEKYVS